MSVSYTQAQKQRYRITLDLEVLGDFNPHQINWEEIFKLEGNERVDSYIEDLNNPTSWWYKLTMILSITTFCVEWQCYVPVLFVAHDIGTGVQMLYIRYIGGGSHSTLH